MVDRRQFEVERTRAPLGAAHRSRFERDGFLVIEDFVDDAHVAEVADLLEPLISATIDCGDQRMDLGDFREDESEATGTLMIMQPQDFAPVLLDTLYLRSALSAAQALLGEDMALDMSMVMEKPPGSASETPWHQDEAYWLPDIPDRRSLSVWLAIDDATIDNGCMWFVPGSHAEPTRKHQWAGTVGQALRAEVSPHETVSVPLRSGSCTLHHGNMLHHARGNLAAKRRRAYITNFRPAAMIAWERERGYDHRSENARNQGEPVARASLRSEQR